MNGHKEKAYGTRALESIRRSMHTRYANEKPEEKAAEALKRPLFGGMFDRKDGETK